MPYKLHWEHKTDPTRTGIGPILGNVTNGIFIPFTKKEADSRLLSISKLAKKGNYELLEVPFLPEDLPELRKIHSFFSSQIELTKEE